MNSTSEMKITILKDDVYFLSHDPQIKANCDDVLNHYIGKLTNQLQDTGTAYPMVFLEYIDLASINREYSSLSILSKFKFIYFDNDESITAFKGFRCASVGDIHSDTAENISVNIGDISKVLSILSKSDNVLETSYTICGDSDISTAMQYIYAILHAKFTQKKALRKCESCGRYFMTKNRTDEKYCSRECSRKAKSERQLINQSEAIQREYRRIKNQIAQRGKRSQDDSDKHNFYLNENDRFIDGFYLTSSEDERIAYLNDWAEKYPERKGKNNGKCRTSKK